VVPQGAVQQLIIGQQRQLAARLAQPGGPQADGLHPAAQPAGRDLVAEVERALSQQNGSSDGFL
jgi:hypothetical protein